MIPCQAIETGGRAVRPADNGQVLHDLRFRALLDAEAWTGLPAPVRRRFSRRLDTGDAVTYAGEIVECRRTCLGKLLTQLCRLIGAPLPLRDDLGVPAIVTVTEDGATGGQFWTRIYGRRTGFPQVIHSSKRFSGPTGLEEFLGNGVGIALVVTADHHALHFQSDHYFVVIGSMRVRVPRWLGPGVLTISHVELGDEEFAFVLTLDHPVLGRLVRQTCLFRERLPVEAEEARHD